MSIAPLPNAAPDFRFVDQSGVPSAYTTAVQKHAIKAADPAFEPHNARRTVLAESLGGAHKVNVSVAPGIAPEAGATMSRGRLIPPAINRSSAFEFSFGAKDFN